MSTIFIGMMGGLHTSIDRLPGGWLSAMQVDNKDDSLDDPHGPVSQVVMDEDVLRELLGGHVVVSGNA